MQDQEPHKMIDDTLDTLPDISCDSDNFSPPRKLTSTIMIDLHSPQGNEGSTAEVINGPTKYNKVIYHKQTERNGRIILWLGCISILAGC